MKKIILILLLAVAVVYPVAASSKLAANEAVLNSNATSNHVTLTGADVKRMSNRIEEIRKMDKRNLTPSQKAVLRQELNAMKNSISKSGPILYFTLGALVAALVIIFVLI
jgi:hypothetical protein